ncbi:ABC transporter substrate-binding protein [Halobacteriales archaeon Cl-PHB]
MRFNRREFIVSSGAAAMVGLAGCSGDGGDGSGDGGDGSGNGTDGGSTDGGSNPLKIGALNPYSGDFSWIGNNTQPALEMVAQEINESGGINGRNVKIIQGDTAGTPDSALPAAKRLINVENVQALIGPSSLTIFTVIDLAKQNNIPIVSPTAGTTELNDQGGDLVFRTVPSDSFMGRGMAVGSYKEQYNGIQSYEEMTIMVADAPNSLSWVPTIRSKYEEIGGTIADEITVSPGKNSYSSEVGSMMDAGANMTALITSREDAVKIIRAAFQAGYEGNFVGNVDVAVSETLEGLPSNATNNMLGVQSGTYGAAQEAGRLEEFSSQLKEFSGEEPRAFARNAYDAINVVGLAAKLTAENGSEVIGRNIANNIPTVAKPPEQKVTSYSQGSSAIEEGTDVDYDGLIGPIDFDEDGDVVAPVGILKAQGDSWNSVGTIPPEDLA